MIRLLRENTSTINVIKFLAGTETTDTKINAISITTLEATTATTTTRETVKITITHHRWIITTSTPTHTQK